ncbi:tyrosine-protein phosphatase [Nocardia transvalensis]|uniref:tyrosine-protein phosphatase n=1 Tax=Nocardia transvalensis TaxID=37333 RepID=UPI00189478CF|nr:tyrosine-protein phosphatase [Nocardia transvalensis]MBF6332814.1 tyrosine-protein phosphatase [Nocardia transvalensis]
MSRIELQGAINVRDLSGMTTSDGHRIRAGRLLRADALHKLTDSDVAVLGDLGVRTVIDFRSPQEIEHDGPDRLPDGATWIDLPIAGGNLTEILQAVHGQFGGPATDLGNGRAAELMREINRQFVAEPGFRTIFARALHLVADPDRGPVLFHCSAGKDRTGWMAAVVLTALGVPRADITADYLATNDYVWPAYSDWLTSAVETGDIADPEPIRQLIHQDPTYLDAAFDEVTARYGSFDQFLSEGLNFTPADRDRLRRTLLE